MISRSQRHETELICDKALQIINDEYMNEDLSLTDASEKLAKLCVACYGAQDESRKRFAFMYVYENI